MIVSVSMTAVLLLVMRITTFVMIPVPALWGRLLLGAKFGHDVNREQ